jgi:hypothetical protein
VSTVEAPQADTANGSNLQTYTLPAYTATPDAVHGPYTMAAGLRAAIYHDRTHGQARNTTAKLTSGVNGEYYQESINNFPSGHSGPNDMDPVFGGVSAGTVTSVDWINAGIWINGALKQGVVFIAQLAETISIANGFPYDHGDYGGWRWTIADPLGPSPPPGPAIHTSIHDNDPTNCHMWYGSAIDGTGHFSPTLSAVGPGADSMVAWFYVYNPDDLIAVLNGAAPYSPSPTTAVRLYTFDASDTDGSSLPIQLSTIYQNVGIWFDPVAKRLYIADRFRWISGFDVLPVIHVFAVDC